MPIYAKRVGVFVDEDIETVRQTADDYALDIIQLHGHESPEYAAQLREWKIVKAISVSSREDILTYKSYEGLVDYFLFDTKCQTVGGSGSKFDWSVLDGYDGRTPFLLSGGIGPDDAARLRAFHHPRCVGIDLNSRFETAPGLKDTGRLRRFLNDIKQQNHNSKQ
jgi:phosphoribosylanthranilate isomerase